MKRKLFTWLVLSAILFLVSSCSSKNQIYFDLPTQTIRTCNGSVIIKLNITKSDFKEDYYFHKSSDAAGTSVFSVTQGNPGYVSDSGIETNAIQEFVLKPSSQYKISSTSDPDKMPSEIIIKTDESGKVNFSSVATCP